MAAIVRGARRRVQGGRCGGVYTAMYTAAFYLYLYRSFWYNKIVHCAHRNLNTLRRLCVEPCFLMTAATHCIQYTNPGVRTHRLHQLTSYCLSLISSLFFEKVKQLWDFVFKLVNRMATSEELVLSDVHMGEVMNAAPDNATGTVRIFESRFYCSHDDEREDSRTANTAALRDCEDDDDGDLVLPRKRRKLLTYRVLHSMSTTINDVGLQVYMYNNIQICIYISLLVPIPAAASLLSSTFFFDYLLLPSSSSWGVNIRCTHVVVMAHPPLFSQRCGRVHWLWQTLCYQNGKNLKGKQSLSLEQALACTEMHRLYH